MQTSLQKPVTIFLCCCTSTSLRDPVLPILRFKYPVVRDEARNYTEIAEDVLTAYLSIGERTRPEKLVFGTAVDKIATRLRDYGKKLGKWSKVPITKEEAKSVGATDFDSSLSTWDIPFFAQPSVIAILLKRVRIIFGTENNTVEQLKTLIARTIMETKIMSLEHKESGQVIPGATLIKRTRKQLWKIRFPVGAHFSLDVPTFGTLAFSSILVLTYSFVSSPHFGQHPIGTELHQYGRYAAFRFRSTIDTYPSDDVFLEFIVLELFKFSTRAAE